MNSLFVGFTTGYSGYVLSMGWISGAAIWPSVFYRLLFSCSSVFRQDCVLSFHIRYSSHYYRRVVNPVICCNKLCETMAKTFISANNATIILSGKTIAHRVFLCNRSRHRLQILLQQANEGKSILLIACFKQFHPCSSHEV